MGGWLPSLSRDLWKVLYKKNRQTKYFQVKKREKKNRILFFTIFWGSFELKLADFIFYDFVFFNKNDAYYLTMGPKKGRRLTMIEIPTDSVPGYELGAKSMGIKWRR